MAINALKVEPGLPPCVVRLRTGRHDLEYAVSVGANYLCDPAIFRLERNVAVLYNDDAVVVGLRGNRRIGGRVIAGVFYVVGIDEQGNLSSLPHEEIDWYWMQLYQPEVISAAEVKEDYYSRLYDSIEDL